MEGGPKILIIRFSSIGDIVLTTPIVRCLKQQIPNAEIHYLTKDSNAIILNNNPNIDRVIIFKGSFIEVLKQLRQEKYSYVIDSHRKLRSIAFVLRLLRPSKSIKKQSFKKWLLVNFKINILPKKHIVDLHFDTVRSLGVKNDGKGLDYFLREEDYISPDALPLSFQDGYVAVVIGSKHNTKQMPESVLIRICNGIQSPIILLGDRDDRAKAIRVENEVGARVFNGCGAYNLNQTAALIKNANGIITPDTGLMHIAAAFDKNIISVWGNTVPEFGLYPYMSDDSKAEVYIFEEKNLKCRPCSRIGFEECPKKHFKCMNSFDEEKIISIANSWPHYILD